MPKGMNRLRRIWDAVRNRDPTPEQYYYESSGGDRPDRVHITRGGEKSIINSIINKIAIDASEVEFHHCTIDENGKYTGTVQSGLEKCLTLEANIDQSGRAMIVDLIVSMLDEGVVAAVPVEYFDSDFNNGMNIMSIRIGKIVEWMPRNVRVELYDDNDGKIKQKVFSKTDVAIVENPFRSIMNEPNSMFQRLKRKLALLDIIDEKTVSDKLNIIIQMPYSTRLESKQRQAEERVKDIQLQLTKSDYGIAYADSAEKITQLNRPLENKFLEQIKYLIDTVYGQIGMTSEILNGTADEKTMNNYYSRVIEPILTTITDEFTRKWLGEEAFTYKQSIKFFRDPFKLIPLSAMGDLIDKLSRNEIYSANEIRQSIGSKPSTDSRADELHNSNMPRDDMEPQSIEEEE